MTGPRRPKRIIGWLLSSCAAFFAALAVLLGVVLGTPDGTRRTLATVLAAVPHVTAGQIRGTLWRGVTIERIHYADGSGLELEAHRVHLALSWPALLALRLHMTRAEAAGVRLQFFQSDAAEAAGPAPDFESLIPNLPLALQIDALSFEDIRLKTGPAAGVIRLAALDTALRVTRSGIVIPHLIMAMDAPAPLHLRADASLEATAPHRLKLRLTGDLKTQQGLLDWSLTSQGTPDKLLTAGRLGWQGAATPDATAHLSVESSLSAARIRTLTVDLLGGSASIAGELDWHEGFAWQAALDGKKLYPGPWLEPVTGPVDFRIESTGRITPRGALTHDSRLTRGRAQIAGLALNDLQLHASGDLNRADIHQLTVSLLDGRLAAQGEIDWQKGLCWQAALTGSQLNPGHLAAAAAGQVGFRMTSRGHLLSGGRLNHEIELADLSGIVAAVPFTTVALSATGDLQSLAVHDLSGRILDAPVAGKADLQWSRQGIDWQTRLSLDNADLSRLKRLDIDPVVKGYLGLDLSCRGRWHDGRVSLTAEVENLHGELEGQEIAGRIRARVDGQRADLESSELHIGANHVFVSGTVTPPFDLQYRLDLPDLSRLPLALRLDPNLAGHLESRGHLRGTLEAPRLEVQLSGRQLAFGALRSTGIDLKADVGPDRLDLDLSLDRLEAANLHVTALDVTAGGRLSDHDLVLKADTDHGHLHLALQGGLQDRRWQGRLTALGLTGTPAGDWMLVRPAAVRVGKTDFLLEEICLAPHPGSDQSPGKTTTAPNPAPARVCASIAKPEEQPIHTTLKAACPLALLQPFLPPSVSLPGTATLAAEAWIGQTLTAEAELILPADRIIAHTLTEAPVQIQYRATRLAISLQDRQLTASLGARLSGDVEVAGEMTAQLDGTQPIGGQISARMADISWLNAVIPEISALAGRADARLLLAGTLNRPALSGQIAAQEISLNLPDTGVAYNQGRLRIDIDSAQSLKVQGELAGTGSGRLRITGDGSLDRLPAWRLQLTIDGEDMPVIRTGALWVDASPALSVYADQHGAQINGRVVLPRVQVQVQTLPEGSVRESADLVLAGQERKTVSNYALRTDIEIVLGKRVNLEGMGFSADLGGQIRLRGDEATPMAAFGEVDIRKGRYVAYGQNLSIDRGRLSFNGPLDDPGLDVSARRTVDDYQAGLKIEGTLKSPRSQVFSEPALPESDALSLLLTGRRLSEGASQSETDLLLNALAGLGIKKGDDIARDIGLAAGFDEVSLGTEDGLEGTQLTIGKRIHPRLLLRYAVGVFDGVSKLITQYKINRYLDLEISSSPEAQGGDLILRIDR